VTVGELVRALSKLPEDTPVVLAWCGGLIPIKWEDGDTFMVHRQDGKTTLYVWTGDATHPDLMDDWESL